MAAIVPFAPPRLGNFIEYRAIIRGTMNLKEAAREEMNASGDYRCQVFLGKGLESSPEPPLADRWRHFCSISEIV